MEAKRKGWSGRSFHISTLNSRDSVNKKEMRKMNQTWKIETGGLIPLVFIALLVVLIGCGDDDSNGKVVISDAARSLLEEVVNETVSDAAFIGTMSHAETVIDIGTSVHLGYAYSLLGSEQSMRGVATLTPENTECTEPILYDLYCDAGNQPPEEPVDPFLESHDRCLRLGCEAEGVHLVEVYYTMRPETSPDEPHAFTYDTVTPTGTGTYEPNPHIKWHVDRKNPAAWVIWADISENVTIMPSSGESLNLSHNGRVTVTKASEDLASVVLRMEFTELSTNKIPVVASVNINAAGDASGAITYNDSILATISGEHEGLIFNWQEANFLP